MAKKKITTVKEHPRKVPVSKKNPTGITIVDKHPRRLDGNYLDRKEIDKIIQNYDLKKLIYPKSDKLNIYSDSDKYDELIAIWTDYSNKKFPKENLEESQVLKRSF